jgi:CHAT domain-containing protein
LFHTQDASSRQDLLDQIFLTEQAMAPASTVLLERSRALGNRRRRVTLSGLQRALRPGELFVEFALDEPHSFAIVASRRATAIRALPSRTEIERAAKALVAQIQSGSDNTPAGQALGAMLLGAIPELADHQRLIVSTDGALNQVPFEVLGDAGGRQLLAAHVLTYVPSASVLVFLRNRRSVVPRRPALVVSGSSAGSKVAQTDGDAIRAGKQIDRGIYDLNGATLAPLPSAADEARFVAATLSGSGTTLLLGDAATEGNFKRQPLEEYRVLHFAVHGVMSTRFPDRSALLLRPNTDDDGLLQAREILGLRLNADLVTLSACDTGNGATYGEDGVASLVRPFFVAGARAVVANLWNADDTFSLALMKAFYRHLAGGEDAGMALRDAKLDMQQEFGPEAVPKLWSGFLMYGDGSTPVVSRSGASR